ncbi:MAG: OsmC family peroxiredoxin [Bacteroidetes bacterium]|nr:MAG: OsmC family peroxiredoxin [Bacteroidota bacterium]
MADFPDLQVAAHLIGDTYTTELENGDNTFLADEPESVGGANKGMRPHEILISALASCTAITLRMYASRKQWQVDEIHVQATLKRAMTDEGYRAYIHMDLDVKGDLGEKERARLLQIARACPVHKTLSNPISITASITE